MVNIRKLVIFKIINIIEKVNVREMGFTYLSCCRLRNKSLYDAITRQMLLRKPLHPQSMNSSTSYTQHCNHSQQTQAHAIHGIATTINEL